MHFNMDFWTVGIISYKKECWYTGKGDAGIQIYDVF